MSARRKILLAVAGTFTVLLLIGLVTVAPLLSALVSFPSMPGAYEAKEYCSCLWVEGRDQTFCDAFVYQSVVPSQGRTVDQEVRRVTARALWRESSARWVSREYGCVIEQP